MSDTEKALNYYRAALHDVRPDFVPARVHLGSRVCGDGPYRDTFAEAGEHDAKCNPFGAVSVLATNGKMLGVRPKEFAVVVWRKNS